MTDPETFDDEATASRSVRKVAVALGGSAVAAAGVVMLVTPGPGILTILAGLRILGKEFPGLKRVLDREKRS